MAMAYLALLAVCLLSSALALPVSFNHGVASGDPTSTNIILWTRVTPRSATPSNSTFNVTYEVSLSSSFVASIPLSAQGVVTTGPERDWTVKVDVSGLLPGRQYFYRFHVAGSELVASSPVTYRVLSPAGTFRLPYSEGSNKQKSLRYAVFSCSNWGFGYFNAYDAAARYDLDFWLHLGDYIYEYGINTYPGAKEAVRWQEPEDGGLAPKDDIVTLDDYRRRHALYRQDAGLQILSAGAPLLSIWDDHEITNNARRDTAENHNAATEGSYADRKEAARKAYFEWIPIREIEDGQYIDFKINKTLSFGKLAKMFLLEERVTGRTDEWVSQSVTTDASTNKFPGPGLVAAVFGAAAGKAPADLNATDMARLAPVKDLWEKYTSDVNATILGAEQMAWVDAETKEGVAKGVTWQLYSHGTVMLPSYTFDFEAAIAKAEREKSPKAAAWRSAWRGVAYSESRTTTSTGLQCYNRPYLGAQLPVSPYMTVVARGLQASGTLKIGLSFDAWFAHRVEMAKFLKSVSQAPNVVQYGGDSHADWAGIQRLGNKTVLAEFDVNGVTSPSLEDGSFLPLDLMSAAGVEAGRAAGLRYAQIGYKGFMLVELDDKVHHTEYIHVDNWCTPNYKASCSAAFDYYTQAERRKRGAPADIIRSKCRAMPSGTPYGRINRINNRMGQQASNVP